MGFTTSSSSSETVEELAAMHNLEVPFEATAATARSGAIRANALSVDGRSEYVLPTIFTTTCCHVCAPVSGKTRIKPRGYRSLCDWFCAPGWAGVLKRFGGNPENRQSLIDAGMLVTNDQGRSYDRFRERVMFPIRDKRGQVIGLAGACWATIPPNT